MDGHKQPYIILFEGAKRGNEFEVAHLVCNKYLTHTAVFVRTSLPTKSLNTYQPSWNITELRFMAITTLQKKTAF